MDQQWQQWQYESLARRNHTSNPRLEPVAYDGGRGIATFVSIGSWCFCGFETRVYGLGLLRVFAIVGWTHGMPFRVQFPAPTLKIEWIQRQQAANTFPPLHGGITSVQAAQASAWLWQRADQGDIPSITQAAADLMGHMFPADMRFGKSGSLQCR